MKANADPLTPAAAFNIYILVSVFFIFNTHFLE